MERYGISWNGERNCIATPMHDGYWTPWHEAQEQLAAANAQRDEMQCKLDELDIYLRCRGAAGETILARVQRIEHDVQAAVSFWQKAQTRGDLLQQHLDQCVRERDELAKSYRETIDDRDALLRIINDAFLSLHIPGSAKAFDGRNLVVHAKDSADVAMVLRGERDAARRDLASLMAAAKSLTDDPNACWEDFLAAVDAIARAQSGQPAPVQQPSTKDVAIQGGECAFFDELPNGPSIGRFSASERVELDELKRKAFKEGDS